MTPAVRERPILFSAPMVRAILDGRKTQTRRVVTNQSLLADLAQPQAHNVRVVEGGITFHWLGGIASIPTRCPFGIPGDRLWVRETFFDYDAGEPEPKGLTDLDTHVLKDERIEYRATPWTHEFADPEDCGPWKPAIHMPRWASRITLEITSVRVERLQGISTHDIGAEGINLSNNDRGARNEYRELWDSLNAKRGYGWNVNPWVWVVAFKRIEATAEATA